MPITTQIEPGTGFRTHTVTGEMSLEAVRQTLQEVYAHPGFRPEAGALWDLTAATGDVATEEVRHLADFVSRLAGGKSTGRVAVLVAGDFGRGMARMYETILGSQSSKAIMLFQDADMARRWLSEAD